MTDEHRTAATESTVDAVADQYVDDSCLLDPLLATYFGIAGYDHELPDISPDGFDAREQLARQALVRHAAAPKPATAEQQIAQRCVRRAALRHGRPVRSQDSAVADQCHLQRAAQHPGCLRPDEDRRTTRRGATSTRASRGFPTDARRLSSYADQPGRRGKVSAKRQIEAIAGQIRAWTGQEGGGRVSSTTWSRRLR